MIVIIIIMIIIIIIMIKIMIMIMIKIVLRLYLQGYTKHSQGAELRATENSVEVLNPGPPDSKSSF